MEGAGADGLSFNTKTYHDVLFVRLLFPTNITGVKTSPGNVYFSNKTPEAAVTVGDAKRNETHANSKKCLFDLLDAD